MKKIVFLMLSILLFVTGCITLGHDRAELKTDLVKNKYEIIKKIVLEEAANNGFSQLTSEIKPSQYNDWKGKLYFALMTPNGTDQLFIEFNKDSVYMHGAGTRTNPDSAIKAIRAKIDQL
ncbi:MAG: hypothetical protein FD174_422 [Geobacteraceae bacterium]|nr:MAG: hypothetical protein FD174_422 [Geobacteraceae bacterium]